MGKNKKAEGTSLNLDNKILLDVLEYAYKKGEQALNYTTKELIQEMAGKLKSVK